MANHSCGKKPQHRTSAINSASSFSEPEVRRWPHPVTGYVPKQETENTLQYIRCALSYQNQLLADMKSILEALRLENCADTSGK